MYAESYQRAHDRIVALIAGKDPDVVVPATPEWTAGDIIRHLTGLAVDLTNGFVDGYASDAWTAAQVSARADHDVETVLAEWAGVLDEASALLDDVESLGLPERVRSVAGVFPAKAIAPMAIGDILHHEFDLRNAYGDTSGRDLMDLHFVAAGHVRSIRPNFEGRGLPTIRVESTDSGMGWDVGYGEPVATLRASSFEIMRGIGGRRTRDEMLGMGWDADPEPFVDAMVISYMAMRDTTLGE
jgi:uncharacterized protein (TIGR03083 family)